MPIPGPRNQFRPLPGYNNPENENPAAAMTFNRWKRPGPMWWPGRTPAHMFVTLRGCVLGPGQVRRFWKQSVNFVPATPAYSWTSNSPRPGDPISVPQTGFQVTRLLRYMTRSLYMGDGIDNTRYENLHTVVPKKNVYKAVTINTGQKRGQPTVRNRVSSFGSRVPTLNKAIAAAEDQDVGEASQA